MEIKKNFRFYTIKNEIMKVKLRSYLWNFKDNILKYF